MKISGEVLIWTGIGVAIALSIGALAGGWFDSNTPSILNKILDGLNS